MEVYSGQAAPGAPVRDNLHRHNFPGRSDLEMVRSTATLDLKIEAIDDSVEVTVVVENTGAGHAFPTGNATAPSVVLEIVATDENGGTVFIDSRDYRVQYVDSSGAISSDPTTAVSLLTNSTLLPLQPRTERFEIPASLMATSLSARLVYHPWNDQSSHLELIAEFTGRYLRNGFRVERVIANLGQMMGVTTPPRGVEPIEVLSVEADIPPQ
jgi:hypothetical protein